MRAILENKVNKKIPQVYVGDPNQDIYNFRPRNASNIFDERESTYKLTQVNLKKNKCYVLYYIDFNFIWLL